MWVAHRVHPITAATVVVTLLSSLQSFAAASEDGLAPGRIELAGTTAVHALPTFDDSGDLVDVGTCGFNNEDETYCSNLDVNRGLSCAATAPCTHPACPHGSVDEAPGGSSLEGSSVNASNQLVLIGDDVLEGFAITAALSDLGKDFMYVPVVSRYTYVYIYIYMCVCIFGLLFSFDVHQEHKCL